VGQFTGNSNNLVQVSVTGSRWDVSGAAVIGGDGSGNQLIISNGVGSATTLGIGSAFGSNNVALVTGAGARWDSAGAVTIGYQGSGNRLTVTNGAQFSAAGLSIGNGAGDSNTVSLSGAAYPDQKTRG